MQSRPTSRPEREQDVIDESTGFDGPDPNEPEDTSAEMPDFGDIPDAAYNDGAGTMTTALALRPETPPLVPVSTAMAPVSEAQRAILMAPVNPDLVEILPTGEVYYPQVQYRRILFDAFGPGGWRIEPVGPWATHGNTISREFALYVEGRLIATAMGEQEYQPTNSRMSYATAAEAAKSNALMRCCKDLGIATELWDKRFTLPWIAEHAVQVWVKGKDKPQWRLKTAEPFYGETGYVAPRAAPAASPRPDPPPTQESEPPNGHEAATGLGIASCRVKKTGTSNGKPYTIYAIEDSNGRKYDTFSDTHADLAQVAMKEGRVVEIEATPGEKAHWAWTMDEIRLLGTPPAAGAEEPLNRDLFKTHMESMLGKLGKTKFHEILGGKGFETVAEVTDAAQARDIYRAMQRALGR